MLEAIYKRRSVRHFLQKPIPQEDLDQILENHGYQAESSAQPGYIHTGVNWGYTGAQLASGLDVQVVAAIAAMTQSGLYPERLWDI